MYSAKQKWDGVHSTLKTGFKTMILANDWIEENIKTGYLPQPEGEHREYYILPEHEAGAAKISVDLSDGTITVRHGGDHSILLKRDAPAGLWNALWDVLNNYEHKNN